MERYVRECFPLCSRRFKDAQIKNYYFTDDEIRVRKFQQPLARQVKHSLRETEIIK